MNEPRYRYEIEYFVTYDHGGKRKKTKEVEFTKPNDKWNHSDWDTLDKYMKTKEKVKECDVQVVAVTPIKSKN